MAEKGPYIKSPPADPTPLMLRLNAAYAPA